ncbi:MAG: hypothetical protein ACOC1F_06110 [Myxococcota bacterium]
MLLREYDAVEQLRADVQKLMLAEARRHRDVKLFETVPGIGKLRAAQIAPTIVSPQRFRTKHRDTVN